ncbi:hypothetical protein IWX90DRAFT_17070 [Phyllosticta citrichinensis]|uniref:2EXR domain-containing protein n=1 Tax=Phyllosticta citrichinensis TaxID=1130410 RepID=A0ABR1Y646_9PEZI
MDVKNIHSGPPQQSPEESSPTPVASTSLRSAPIDPRYTYDIAREIRNAWSNHDSKCCPDTSPYCELHREATSSSDSRPQTQRKSLAAHLKEPSPLFAPGPVDPQNSSPLFRKLPPEIRGQIWTHLLTYPSVVLLVADGGLPRTHYARHLTPSLLSSCRRIHLEAAPILYGRNAFSVVHIPNMLRSRSSAPRFVLSPRYFPLLRRLNIDVPDKWIERRVFTTRWGAELERYTEVLGALVRCAGPRLRHLQISLVRNCALESYTSWGPYVADCMPLMQAVSKDFLPAARESGDIRTKFLLVLPCGGGGGNSSDNGGDRARVALDVLRPDAPAVIHAVARNLGTLQKTARLNGVGLAESLVVEVAGEGGCLLGGEVEAEAGVRREDDDEEEGPLQIVLSLSDQARPGKSLGAGTQCL